MSRTRITGPVRVIRATDGTEAPFFIIPFDRRGVCTGPETRNQLVEQVRGATDVFVFAHGWNNDWKTATGRFDAFVTDYMKVRAAHWPLPDRPYRPVLAGVFWPSTALVAPWEQAPDIAAGPPPPAAVAELAEGLPPDEGATLAALAARPSVTPDEARTLVRIVSSSLDPEHEEAPGGVPTHDSLLDAWAAMSVEDAGTTSGTSPTGVLLDDDEGDDGADGDADDPATAGWGVLDPRGLLRLATVLQMKDRAGRVGSTGVADLLLRCHAVSDARIHLIGHSYGAKVMLSALLATGTVTVDSVLLLQPAVSAYCFAPAGAVPGTAQPGGYHAVPDRVRLPLLTTYSQHDFALHRAFQWAARRRADLGEAAVAAGGPPSRYAALGGYGPQGVPSAVVDAVEPPTPYVLPTGEVVGIRADEVISGHGAVVSAAVSWMLLSQVRS